MTVRVGFGITVLARCMQRGGVDGIGKYCAELLERFRRQSDIEAHPFSLGVDAAPLELENVTRLPHYAISAALGLPSKAARGLANKVDLIHATDHLIPYAPSVPILATLMDAIPFSHPEFFAPRFRRVKVALWRRSAHRAHRVVTISDHARREIAHHFRIPEERIDVVPLGVNASWSQDVPTATLEHVRQHLRLPDRFFLCVGTLQPRKNVKRVIDAFCSLPPEVREDSQLIVAGRAGWQCEAEVAALQSGLCGGAVRWVQHVSDSDLLACMKQATTLVFPSLYEGFGLPVVEAFASGTPVITSRTTALPEVAGDAALLVDPENTGEIAEAMKALLQDASLRETLQQRGRERARHFTWERTAEATRQVYYDMLGR